MSLKEHKGQEAAYVETRFRQMATLKAHRVPAVRSYFAEYADSPSSNTDGVFRTNVGFALVQSKASDFIATLPKFDFQPLSDDARNKIPTVKRVWDYWWKIGETEKELLPLVIDALIAGAGYAYEYVRSDEREVEIPDGRGGYSKKTVKDERPVLERVEWENAFINSTSIDAATECVIVRHWLRDEFLSRRKKMLEKSGVDEKDIPKGKRYDWFVTSGSVDVSVDGKITGDVQANREEYVSELHWYSKFEDKYVIVANGVKIEQSPLPSLHKELPLLVLTDHAVNGDHTGRGEYDVTADARKLKDSASQLGIDLTKASIGAMFADDNANIQDGQIKFSLTEVNQVGDVEGLKHFVPSVNLQFAQHIEGRADDYITAITGVDWKGMLMSPSETASKTVAKVETQKRRVALAQRQAAWTFFARFAKLRMSDIALLHKVKRTISVEGETIDNGVSRKLNGGYGVFTVEPKMVTDMVNVLPNIESMATDSSTQRQDVMQLMQIVASLVKEDGKPVAKPEAWMDVLQPYFPNVDFEALVKASETTKSPDEIMKEAGILEEPQMLPEQAGQGMATDPNFIPPAQRSGAKKAVSTPGSRPKVTQALDA